MTGTEKSRQRSSAIICILSISAIVAFLFFVQQRENIMNLLGMQVYADSGDVASAVEGANNIGVSEAQGSSVTLLEEVTDDVDKLKLVSPLDKDQDNIDDYQDIVLGARAYIETRPTYDGGYVSGGYPDENRGACTDVIWRALDSAGYDLKSLMDGDIRLHPERYPNIVRPDLDIDFRRVRNISRFLSVHADALTTNISNPEDWQPGDIVIFENHIAICSDIRNDQGIPYLLHHDMGGAREADDMESDTVKAHYRWNGNLV